MDILEERTIEIVTRFYCEHCNEYFAAEELSAVDCSHKEEYHGHPIWIEDHFDCCPVCGGEVCEKFVKTEVQV